MRYLPRPNSLFVPLVLLAAPLAGQGTLALAGGRPLPARPAIPVNPLREAYALRLTSDWPQYRSGAGCVNGGDEVVAGTLEATEAGYAGTLRRDATIRFCGSHGQASDACTLTLTSSGPVDATARVYTVGESAMLLVSWQAPEGAGEATVHGDCAPAFEDSVRRLYFSVAHSLEVPLPAGSGGHTVRLEDYGWIAEVR